jgi:hypothetical protein
MNDRSKKPLVLAIAVFVALMVAVLVATLSMTVECPYCHNSNANVKGNCVMRQRGERCREDYYPEHHNKADCGWCKSTGKMTMFDAWAD